MFKGFYNLTSGMLTQQRQLNVVANNMTNISTTGFKSSRYTSTTFDEAMYSRVGNKFKPEAEEIGQQTYIRASSQVYTDFTQGVLEPTGLSLDFAIEGNGFFAIQAQNGPVVYTRKGAFSLDDDGYLTLAGFGRVLDNNLQPIQLGTDRITSDAVGNLFTMDGFQIGRLGVFDFANYQALEHNDEGFFMGGGAQAMENPRLHYGYVERSNTDMVTQMTEMMQCQRALQSAATLSKMYDNLMNKATNDVGRV